jgi:hypothetical protein
MHEKFKNITGKLFRAAAAHKIITAIIVLLIASWIYSGVAGPIESGTTGTSSKAQASTQDALTKTVYGFMNGYGTYSYQDVLDTKDLEAYAHKDLVAAVVGERVKPYLPAGEAEDLALAQDRMAELGLVKVVSVEGANVASQDEAGIQVTVTVRDTTFTSEQGITEAQNTYILTVKQISEAGIGSPYQVLRVFKQ